MPPRKNKDTKGKANKRVKSTHTPVSDVDDPESSRASTQDFQPASQRALGKRTRHSIPDSDVVQVTLYEIDRALSHPPTNSDSSDVIMQRYRSLLSPSSDEVTPSEDRNTTYEEELKTLNRLCRELPDNPDEANYVPLSDILANFESIIPKLDAHYAKLDGMQNRCMTAITRRLEVFGELETIHDMMKLHIDAYMVKLEAFLARMRVGDKKLWEINYNRRGSLLS